MSINKITLTALTLSIFTAGIGNTEELIYRSPTGTVSIVEIQHEDSFGEILSRIQSEIHEEFSAIEPQYLLDFMAVATPQKYSTRSSTRTYQPLTPEQEKDLSYIISTLGTNDLKKIVPAAFKLKQAGNRIDDIHPFQFLLGIFGNEKLKAAAQNIKKTKIPMVWNGFYDGIHRGLTEEADVGNLSMYVDDFAEQLNLDAVEVHTLIDNRKWKELVNLLLKIPRKGNHDRYDM